MIDTDWRQLNKSFFDVLTVEANVMFAILTLIVLVAALNIVSGLIMLVQDKARAIAVLRTMGATRGAIMRIFLITGAAIGVVGTACGLALGLVVAHNVEPIRKALLSWLIGVNLFPAEFYFLSQIALARRAARRRRGGRRWRWCFRWRRRSTRRGARRGSIRSRRCAMSDAAAPRALAGRGIERRYGARRDADRGAERRRAERCGRASRWRWSRPRAPASRRCCISPACWRQPDAGEVYIGGDADRDDVGRPAHRAAPRARSASSTSSITCCRNSRRWRTSSCRR